MTCPRCFADCEPRSGKCPECGVQLVQNVSGVMKTSAVMIAAAGERGFYRSVQEVPEPLRTQLLEITASANSGTIVIADRAGRDKIPSVIGQRRPAGKTAPGGTADYPSGPRDESPFPGSWILGLSFLGLSGPVWAGLMLLLGAVGIIGAVFAIR